MLLSRSPDVRGPQGDLQAGTIHMLDSAGNLRFKFSQLRKVEEPAPSPIDQSTVTWHHGYGFGARHSLQVVMRSSSCHDQLIGPLAMV